MVSSLSSIPLNHLRPRLRKDSANPFTSIEQVLEVLEKAYGQSKEAKQAIARGKFHRLRQEGSFATFWATFQSLAAYIEL